MTQIRTVICDDVKSICEGYKMFMDNEEDFNCVGMAFNAEECIKLVKDEKPDLVLLDIQLDKDQLGFAIIRILKEIHPKASVIMLTSHNINDFIFHSVMEGADGYVMKNPDGRKTLAQVRKIYNEKSSSDSDTIDVMSVIKEEVKNMYDSKASLMYMISNITKLSSMELEVLRDIYAGMTYKEIAQKRFVEEGTIKSATSRILKKFNEKKMKDLIEKLKELYLFDYM